MGVVECCVHFDDLLAVFDERGTEELTLMVGVTKNPYMGVVDSL